MTRPASELAHLFRALKAPAAARALPKLADRARSEEWSFEQFAAALLKTEVDSRDSHGGQSRIKAARFPARKTLEEFDFAFQTSIRREAVLHLGQLDFIAGRENVVLLGPPGTGKTHLAIAIGIRACLAGHPSPSAPPPNGSPCSPTHNAPAASTTSSRGCNDCRY
jgi:DNA replication protein DnaC